MNWKLIPKDKWGLFEATDEFCNDLPCVVYDEEWGQYEVVNKDSLDEWTHDLSKQQYKWYLPFQEKGGEK